MRINEISETRSFSPVMNPLQKLINEYQYFTSFGTLHLDQKAKSPDSAKEIIKVIQRLQQDNKTFQNLSKEQLENNKNKILTHIHSMLNYIISHYKEHLKDDAFIEKKKQINNLITLYNSLL
jgi:negative regulator of replication initiation